MFLMCGAVAMLGIMDRESQELFHQSSKKFDDVYNAMGYMNDFAAAGLGNRATTAFNVMLVLWKNKE